MVEIQALSIKWNVLQIIGILRIVRVVSVMVIAHVKMDQRVAAVPVMFTVQIVRNVSQAFGVIRLMEAFVRSVNVIIKRQRVILSQESVIVTQKDLLVIIVRNVMLQIIIMVTQSKEVATMTSQLTINSHLICPRRRIVITRKLTFEIHP